MITVKGLSRRPWVHSPIGEPLSLFALKNVAVKGHTQGQIKGMVDSGSPVIGLLNLVEP